MQTIDAYQLAELLADADVPADTVTPTIDLGGYPSERGLYVLTDNPTAFARALVALGEAIGQGAAVEAHDLTATTSGGTYGGARELCAHLPGWTLSGALAEPAPPTDDEASQIAAEVADLRDRLHAARAAIAVP